MRTHVGNPFPAPLFPKPPTVSVTLWTTGTQEKKLIGYDTPCETPGEFTDFSSVRPTPLQAWAVSMWW
jgi:hypothetical protein